MRDGAKITAERGGHRYNNGWMFRCPVHDDRTPSASIRGDGLVTCFAGCARAEVEAALDALGFPDEGRPTGPVDQRAARKAREEVIRRARQMWDDAGHRTYDLSMVEWYLRHRHITLPVPAVIRRWEVNGVMFAVESPGSRITAVQTKSLGRKGITHGRLGRGAVRLAVPIGGGLGLAEGVETAMSATQLTGVPCWASLGAQRMDAVELPADVHHVHLFPDNDDPGRSAAARAVARYTAEGRHVTVHWPPEQDNDWNDTLRRR